MTIATDEFVLLEELPAPSRTPSPMDKEEFERIKAEEKAHLRQLRRIILALGEDLGLLVSARASTLSSFLQSLTKRQPHVLSRLPSSSILHAPLSRASVH